MIININKLLDQLSTSPALNKSFAQKLVRLLVLLYMIYSSTSLVRGFWDEIFCPSKPRTTEEPRTKEGPIKADL